MCKRLFLFIGALAIMLAFALNLRHASNDYELRTSTFWSYVEAQSTTGGTGGGSGAVGPVYCLLEHCEKYICNYEGSCVFHFEMYNGIIVDGPYNSFWCQISNACKTYVGLKPAGCSYGYPPYHVAYTWVNDCFICEGNSWWCYIFMDPD